MMHTEEYKDMVRDSKKKTEQDVIAKRRCHQARLAVKRSREDYQRKQDTKLAREYAEGFLAHRLSIAERAYSRHIHGGVAVLLPVPE